MLDLYKKNLKDHYLYQIFYEDIDILMTVPGSLLKLDTGLAYLYQFIKMSLIKQENLYYELHQK